MGVVRFYRPAVLRKSLYQPAVSFDAVLRFTSFFSEFLWFLQLFHSRQPFARSVMDIIGSLSSDVFQARKSTGSGLFFFSLLNRDFKQIFGQIVSIRVHTLSNTD